METFSGGGRPVGELKGAKQKRVFNCIRNVCKCVVVIRLHTSFAILIPEEFFPLLRRSYLLIFPSVAFIIEPYV